MAKKKKPGVTLKAKSTKSTAESGELAMPIVFGRNDSVLAARFEKPNNIFVAFGDGLTASIPLVSLGLPGDELCWESVTASPTGEAVFVRSKNGDNIPIDASSLRYFADPVYAESMERTFDELQIREGGQAPVGAFDAPAQTPRF